MAEVATLTVAADGAFTVAMTLPCDPAAAGTRHRVLAQTGSGKYAGDVVASSVFTIAAPAPLPSGLPQTGGGGQASMPLPTSSFAAAPLLTLTPDSAPLFSQVAP